jgi:eukaryotic-like serine/threonine-protein kinase
LECAHAMQVLHREIKPTSILLEQRNGTEQARLMDFSLEWLCQIAHVSRYSLLKGQTSTVTWMPPEQVYNSRELQPGSDLYALAATFYTILTGRTLFVGDDTIENVLRRVLEDEPTPLRLLRPEVNLPFADVLHRALAKEPESRFTTAREFRRALELIGQA